MRSQEALVQHLIREGTGWIAEQRATQRPLAQALPDIAHGVFGPFFPAAMLEAARYRLVSRIENPVFLNQLRLAGVTGLLDFSGMAGITFQDTILISEKAAQAELPRLLFHELVLVVQYQILWLDEFARQYVTGWATTGRDYRSIPLEAMAYELESQFRTAPTQAFSVTNEIGCRLGESDRR